MGNLQLATNVSKILGLLFVLLACANVAQAVPVPCIVCGSTPIVGVAANAGTVSFAVISAADFVIQGFPFVGAVPGGTLDLLGSVPGPTDFVYMYQTVNTGGVPGTPLGSIASFEVDIGSTGPTFTAGGRVESTIFIDPVIGLVSLGPIGATPALTPGSPVVDFSIFMPGPCAGSAGDRQCSDSTTDLLPTAVKSSSYGEAPSAPLLDPTWTSSIMWFATPLPPGLRLATIFFADGTSASGLVAAPIPEPGTLLLLGSALAGLAYWRKRSG
jgi:hypothetical protein